MPLGSRRKTRGSESYLGWWDDDWGGRGRSLAVRKLSVAA